MNYHTNLLFSEEDGGWIADIPDLAHCSALGETPEEALQELQLEKAAADAVLCHFGNIRPLPQFEFRFENDNPRLI